MSVAHLLINKHSTVYLLQNYIIITTKNNNQIYIATVNSIPFPRILWDINEWLFQLDNFILGKWLFHKNIHFKTAYFRVLERKPTIRSREYISKFQLATVTCFGGRNLAIEIVISVHKADSLKILIHIDTKLFFVTMFVLLSDLQLRDKKVTLNYLVLICLISKIVIS